MNVDREGTAGLADRIAEATGRASLGNGFDRERVAARIGSRRLARIGVATALGLAVVGASLGDASATLAQGAHTGRLDFPTQSADGRPDDGASLYDSWWGKCDTKPLSAYPAGPTDTFSLTTDLQPGTTVEEGARLETTATLTALVDADVWTSGIDVAFLSTSRSSVSQGVTTSCRSTTIRRPPRPTSLFPFRSLPATARPRCGRATTRSSSARATTRSRGGRRGRWHGFDPSGDVRARAPHHRR